MVPAAIAAVPDPVWIAGDLVAASQSIGPGFLRVESERVLAWLAAGRHCVRFVVIVVIARDKCVSVWREDAIFDAIPVRVKRSTVSTVEVGIDFGGYHVRSVGGEQDRQREGITGHFIYEKMRGGII